MANDLVPLVMLPRHSTYAGRASPTQYFSTIGLDVSEYDEAILNAWRGHIVGTITPGFALWFEESTDQDSWTRCVGSPPGAGGCDPGENTEQQYTIVLRKRWFRMRWQLGGADNVVTCWAVGFLHLRNSRRDGPPQSGGGGGLMGLFRKT